MIIFKVCKCCHSRLYVPGDQQEEHIQHYYTCMCSLSGICDSKEAVSCDEMFAENRMEGLGPVVQHRIIAGTYFLSYR